MVINCSVYSANFSMIHYTHAILQKLFLCYFFALPTNFQVGIIEDLIEKLGLKVRIFSQVQMCRSIHIPLQIM